MTRKHSRLIAAGFGALTMLAGAAVYAHDVPLSVNDAGPVAANHETAPTNAAPAVGRSGQRSQAHYKNVMWLLDVSRLASDRFDAVRAMQSDNTDSVG